MARTDIDLDDAALAAVQKALGTRAIQHTFDHASQKAEAEATAAEEFAWWASNPLPDLREPEVMAEAWR